MSDNHAKYGDNEKYEAFIDNKLYFPIADILVDPLKNIGLTPNNVTVLSTFFTLFTIYFIEKNKTIYAVCSYIFGYILDCVDGKMARKYNMGTDFGMVLDSSSDYISNIILLFYLLYKYKINKQTVIYIIIFFIIFMLFTLSFSINEAIDSYNKTGDDNFYKIKYNKLSKYEDKVLYNLYLNYTKYMYKIYRLFFPIYDIDKLNNILPFIKEFGPGTINTILAIIIYTN